MQCIIQLTVKRTPKYIPIKILDITVIAIQNPIYKYPPKKYGQYYKGKTTAHIKHCYARSDLIATTIPRIIITTPAIAEITCEITSVEIPAKPSPKEPKAIRMIEP